MIDIAACLNDIVYRLGFAGLGDLNAANSWVGQPALYQWAEDAVKRLAREVGLFVVYDTMPVTAGVPIYILPASHIFTFAALLGAQELRITPVANLWALNSQWPTVIGDRDRKSVV